MLGNFDSWLYANESIYTREEKSKNFWKVNGKTGNNWLFMMRVLAILIWISIEWPLILNKEGYVETFLKFYTNWTFYTWSVWLVCIIYSQIIYEQIRLEPATPSDSLLQLWKVCSTLFCVSFLHSIMVSLLWFLLIYPTLNPSSINMTDYLKHSLPSGTLLLEFFFNSIVIEARYIIPVLVYGTFYLLWLIYYTTTGDRWIYSVLKLDKRADWGLLFLIILSYLMVFSVLSAMNELKFTLIYRTKACPA